MLRSSLFNINSGYCCHCVCVYWLQRCFIFIELGMTASPQILHIYPNLYCSGFMHYLYNVIILSSLCVCSMTSILLSNLMLFFSGRKKGHLTWVVVYCSRVTKLWDAGCLIIPKTSCPYKNDFLSSYLDGFIRGKL